MNWRCTVTIKIAEPSAQDEIRDTKPLKSKKIIMLAMIVAAAALLLWQVTPLLSNWQQSDMSVAMSRVRLDSVKTAPFVRDVSVQGKVVAAVSPKLYASADGTVSFFAEAGTQVKKGDVIAAIDSPELDSKLKQEQATLNSLSTGLERQIIQSRKQQLIDQKAVDLAKVALITAEREKRRAEQGYSVKAISQIDYEKAGDDLNNASLQHQHAVKDAVLNKESLEFESTALQQELQRQTLLVANLSRQVDALQVKSPVDGIIGNLATDNKTYLTKNQLLLSVVDLTQFEVEIAIPENYADDLAIGMPADITLDQQTYPARLVSVSPEIVDNQVTGRVRFEKASPPGLRQNQRLASRILLEQRDAVLQVSRGQFLESSNGQFAYIVKNGLAVKTPISIGARSLSAVEVLSGLAEGDQIIISGTDMFNGAQQIQLNH
ncbi:HlyD family efflux transporter periplasmic adaptor subunit [Rheinheimera riviphila]|uniref:HlyD family efflux transporter periplasmic adaptor subunit n=1 Tax=Rheinheimera riviphila TaxID=1834037 RepID=A0A437QS67_9GAMM|nr:HlyD family efflux transporter periplasmic adaptor subunit [Rheinheimera riviphila]